MDSITVQAMLVEFAKTFDAEQIRYAVMQDTNRQIGGEFVGFSNEGLLYQGLYSYDIDVITWREFDDIKDCAPAIYEEFQTKLQEKIQLKAEHENLLTYLRERVRMFDRDISSHISAIKALSASQQASPLFKDWKSLIDDRQQRLNHATLGKSLLEEALKNLRAVFLEDLPSVKRNLEILQALRDDPRMIP